MSNILEFIIKFKDQMSSGMTAIGANADRVFSRIDGRARTVGTSIQGINTRLDALQRTRDISVNLREIRQASREIQNLERQRDRLTGKGGGGLGGALSTGIAVASTGMLLREGAMQATKQQGLEDAIRFSMGKNSGNAMLAHIKERSSTLGLDQMASLEGAKTFLGATRGKLSESDQVKTFDAVGEAITSFKLSAEDAKGVFLALGQIASKGTVSAEELRGQIGERIPGAFSLAAKAMNVTEGALGDMMQKGELAAGVFLPKFAAELHKTFGVEAINSSSGAQANFNRLNNALNDVKNKIGTELLPAMQPFIMMLIDTFNWVSANARPLLVLAAGIGTLVLGYKAWTAAQWLINAAMAANPVGIILVGIGLLITAIMALVAKFGGAGKAWIAVKDTFIQVWEIIKNAFKQYVDNIVSFWQYLFYKVVGFIDRMAQKAANLGRALKAIGNMDFEGAGKYWDAEERSTYDAEADKIKAGWADRTLNRYASAKASASTIMDIWKTSSATKANANPYANYNFSGSGGSGKGSADPAGALAKNKVNNDVNSITGGGTRNTYITLGKFQDSINIHVASAKEGVDQMQEMIENSLLRILNSTAQ